MNERQSNRSQDSLTGRFVGIFVAATAPCVMTCISWGRIPHGKGKVTEPGYDGTWLLMTLALVLAVSLVLLLPRYTRKFGQGMLIGWALMLPSWCVLQVGIFGNTGG